MQSMKKQIDPGEELRKKLFDIEVSLHLTQEDKEEISVRLVILNKLYADLVYNINLLQSGTVTSAFNNSRKTLEDLKKTREEIQKILNLQIKLENKMNRLVVDHDYYNSQYEIFSAFEDKNKVLKMEDYAKRKKDPERKD